jgi:hypothetical protein
MTRTARGLIDLLKKLGWEDLPKEAKVERVRAGHHQRSAGAWSWVLLDDEGYELIGSCWPAKEILAKASRVFVYTNDTTRLRELCISPEKAV